MFKLMDALDNVHLYPGQILYCKNGDTVRVRDIAFNSMLVEYKGKLHIRKVSESLNITLFETPYEENRHYYDIFGYDSDGFDKDGFGKDGYNSDGYDREGFSRSGYDREGYGRDGYNRNGYDRSGYDRDGFDRYGYNAEGIGWNGFDKNGYDINGQYWIEVAQQLPDGEKKKVNGRLCCNTGLVRKCIDCGSEFVFSFGEYDWFQKKGFDNPKRCALCRKKKKQNWQKQDKYDGLLETMNRNDNKKMTGRQMAYRYYGGSYE